VHPRSPLPLPPPLLQEYSRDVFLFMFLVLLCVAAGSSLQHFKAPLLLNRPQTEEWKGWMQVGSSRPGLGTCEEPCAAWRCARQLACLSPLLAVQLNMHAPGTSNNRRLQLCPAS
jgi:hypothetical protein